MKFEIKPNLKKILKKIIRRDKLLYEQVMKKIEEVINSKNIDHYKNLRYNMKNFKRVHVGSFVLIFKFEQNLISFEDLQHHDYIYRR